MPSAIETNNTATLSAANPALIESALAWFKSVCPKLLNSTSSRNLIIEKASYLEEIKSFHAKLSEIAPDIISSDDTKNLWKDILKGAHNISETIECFNTLRRNQIPIGTNVGFFWALISEMSHSNNASLVRTIQLLNDYQIALPNDKEYAPYLYSYKLGNESPEDIKAVFDILEQYGIEYKNNPPLAFSVMRKAKTLLDIHIIFDCYIKNGSDPQKHRGIFVSIVTHYNGGSAVFTEAVQYLNNIKVDPDCFIKLIGVIYRNCSNQDFLTRFKFLLSWNIFDPMRLDWLLGSSAPSFYWDCISHCNNALLGKGINCAEQPELIDTLNYVINKAVRKDFEGTFIRSFDNILDYLEQFESEYKTDLSILTEHLKFIRHAHQWDEAFLVMKEAGYTPDGDPACYKVLIDAKKHALKLAKAWLCFNQAGATDSPVFDLLVDRAGDVEDIEVIFSLLGEFHISYAEHPEYFTEELFFTNDKLFIHTFTELKQAGYSAEQHYPVYSFFIEQLHQWPVDYLTLHETLKHLCDFARTSPLLAEGLEGWEQQKEAIATILSADNNPNRHLTYGPLNLSRDTEGVIAICRRIVECGLDQIEMDYKEGSYFFRDLATNTTINLSLMIRNANLSQLCLDQELMDLMGQVLTSMCPYWRDDVEELAVLEKLHPAEKVALNIYTCYGYLNMNRLFRGVEQITDPDLPSEIFILSEENESKEVAVHFILGCLMHNLINRVIHLQDVPAGLDVGSLNRVLDRKEDITQDVMRQREANPGKLPALTSFSFFKHGSPAINTGTKSISTQVDNAGAYPCVQMAEGEMLLSQGQRLAVRQLGPDRLIASIVSSPSLEYGSGYWSDLALQTVWDLHLKHPYKKQPEAALTQEGNTVNRPNYGLSHAFHVQTMITHTLEYFARHASEERFRNYCRNIPVNLVEMIRIAAVFCDSGRLSEFSYWSDPIGDVESFEESANYFAHFTSKMPVFQGEAKKPDPLIVLFCLFDTIRGLSNPDFEKEVGELLKARAISPARATTRIYLHRILSFARDISLVHSRSAREYKLGLSRFFAFVEQSEKQCSDLNERVHYVMQLHKAHGNRMRCDMADDGNIVDVSAECTLPLFKVSNATAPLYQAADGVTHPAITLAFEWEGKENAFKRGAEGKTSGAKRIRIEEEQNPNPSCRLG